MKRAVIMTEEGNKLMTLLWEPISSLFKKDLVLVEFANATLYDGSFIDLMNWLKAEGFVFNNVSRIDYCFDFNRSSEHEIIMNGLDRNAFHVKRSKRSASFRAQSGKVREIVQMCWGSKESSIRIKLYDKVRELREASDKPYIRNCWVKAGLGQVNVWRWEVSLTGVSSMEFNGSKFTEADIMNPDIMIEVARNLYSNKFVILDKRGNKRKFLDLESAENNLYRKWVGTCGMASSPVCSIVTGLMKQFMTLEMTCMDARKDLFNCIYKIVCINKLQKWFEQVYGVTIHWIDKDVERWYREQGYNVYQVVSKPKDY